MLGIPRQGRQRTICGAPVGCDFVGRHVATTRVIKEESTSAKRLERRRADKSGDRETMQQIASYANGIATTCGLIKVQRLLVTRILAND
jgi:hypothetical protein